MTRTVRLDVRVTPAEKARIQRTAGELGSSEYMRRLAVRDARERLTAKKIAEGMSAIQARAQAREEIESG